MNTLALMFKSMVYTGVFFLIACNTEDSPSPYDVEVKEAIYQVMEKWYLWDEHIPSGFNPDHYHSYSDVVDGLKFHSRDHWSFIAPKSEVDALIKGEYIGYGFGQAFDPQGDLCISFVYNETPAAKAGLKRSMKLLEVNGKNAAALINSDQYDAELGPREVGYPTQLKLEDQEGETSRVTLIKQWIKANTVLYHNVYKTGNLRIGYLVFNGFRENASTELTRVFNEFENQQVNKLIMDLRYNPGGLNSIAVLLASILAPQSLTDQRFVRLIHNQQQTSQNKNELFKKVSHDFNFFEIVFITSRQTASASELVINGLKPYLDVVVIGESTAGKPVGSYIFEIGDQALSPISYKVLNRDDEGDYYNGITADKSAPDGLDKAWGDIEEASLKEALFFLKTGSFSRLATPSYAVGSKAHQMSGFQAEIGAY